MSNNKEEIMSTITLLFELGVQQVLEETGRITLEQYHSKCASIVQARDKQIITKQKENVIKALDKNKASFYYLSDVLNAPDAI